MPSTPEHLLHVAAAANKVANIGVGTAVSGGFVAWTVENAAFVSLVLSAGGLLVAISGLGVMWYYRHKHYQLALRRHELERTEGV